MSGSKILFNLKKISQKYNEESDKRYFFKVEEFLLKSMEGFACAAQEQALRTRWLRAKIKKEDISEKCRICGKQIETIVHVVADCEVL